MLGDQTLIMRAARFAREAHAGQRRKFSGLPYIVHPARVAGRVAVHPSADVEMVAAALLHDVVEDTPCTLAELEREFGPRVASLVNELTKPDTALGESRAERKAREIELLAGASESAKIIKLLDRIDNLQEMLGAPTEFIGRYREESRKLATAIGDADVELHQELLGYLE